MLRKVVLLLIVSVTAYGVFAQSGSLKGVVKDPSTGEAIPFANVTVQKGSSIITGGMTDFDGKYTIKPIPPGNYTVKATYVGYAPKQIDGVIVSNDKITFLNFDLSSGIQITEVEIYAKPLIDPDQVSTGGTVGQEEIKKMPGRSAEAVASTVAGVYSEDGAISSIRGAREDATVYYIDGVKVRGTNSLPKSAMADVSVLTGGIPAKFGDATGGIVSISTNGPSKEMAGGAEILTSQFLDAYGYNLIELNLTGPLLHRTVIDRYDSTKTERKPLAGFFLSGNFSYEKDWNPRANGVWVAKEDVVDGLENDLVRQNPGALGSINNAFYLHEDSFEKQKYNPNLNRYRAVAAGRFDVKPSAYLNVAMGGSFDYYNRMEYTYRNTLFNSSNNGQLIYNNWRVWARLTQRFADKSPDEEQASASLVKNAFYRIQVDYSKENYKRQSPRHKDNLFNYGYVGKFETFQTEYYEFTDTITAFPNGVYTHINYEDTMYSYTYSDINPVLAQYTQEYYDLYDPNDPTEYYRNETNVQTYGGLLNGLFFNSFPDPVYNTSNKTLSDGTGGSDLWNSIGTPYNSYQKFDNNQFRISAAASADLKDHEISLGFEFEQRTDRAFRSLPVSLWTLAKQYTNSHITQLDFENPIYHYDAEGVIMDSLSFNRLYDANSQALFDIKLRESLGMDVDGTNWIDVDSYDPSELSIEFFSAEELLNSGSPQVTYYGYDHHGNKLNNNPSFAEFFTEQDEYGFNKREIAPFQPTYAAAYIQDKFGFKDLVFNVGIRIDRYDANQMVLKDPYVLREVYTAGEVSSVGGETVTHPDGMGDDFVVYVDNFDNPTNIVGYRDGNNWYNGSGTPITDPDEISTATGIAPYLINPDAELDENAFEDYKPQITPMPRVSFSFPISDMALFFAHYDVLSTRPQPVGATTYNRLDPVEYLYIEASPDYISNPNLKPEKTIDYELGFQQKLNDNSSLKLSAFYREMRDMIQIISVEGGYPTEYTTYGNMDFGTVKGFQVSYFLRRSGNASIRANYSLQFANGTGSDPNTAQDLIRAGFANIRFSNPFDYDQRHNLQLNIDFRLGGNVSGRPYNGPQWFGRDVLANTGVNFTIQAGSGKPYNRRSMDTDDLVGSINGSRMPWSKTVNMRLDRDFIIKMKDKGEDKRKEVYLNVYLDIFNMLNTANIYNVHAYSGNPEDDGYLEAARNQTEIAQQIDEEAYRNYYSMFINYPFYYSRPRTTRLGLLVNF